MESYGWKAWSLLRSAETQALGTRHWKHAQHVCPPPTGSFCLHWNMFTCEGITSPGSAPLLLTWRTYVLPWSVYPPALLLHKPRQFFHGSPLSIFKGNRDSPQRSHHLGLPRMWLPVVSSFRLISLSMALVTQSQRDPRLGGRRAVAKTKGRGAVSFFWTQTISECSLRPHELCWGPRDMGPHSLLGPPRRAVPRQCQCGCILGSWDDGYLILLGTEGEARPQNTAPELVKHVGGAFL